MYYDNILFIQYVKIKYNVIEYYILLNQLQAYLTIIKLNNLLLKYVQKQ